ncbi:protein-methionine sulfoxide oxidase mical2b isoform X2 [Cyclopterus lumpus]|uniref:protein-methionine sulfoxide oxidase mical2b isoform X2 n=1 Tax=Cyclopterus lumpus TaxID=8103 RepID=UPI0014860F70|nr:protein-methionine sulfoxide oxidase mical2b isoform X2 [Cyclopterus lumpus]
MSAVKALQQWCRVRCDGYRDVSITNMTTSFRDGLAFCALIHKHRPDLINFDSLKKEDVYENNKLAFKVAEELGIPALLDAEDMVALRVPDRLSILTYVSQYYNYFHGRSPIGGMAGVKRPADGPAEEPSGKKNQPVAAKAFPSSQPARENSPPPSANITRPSPSPKQARSATKEVAVERSHQTGTLSNKCVSCSKHVHLVQRHLVDGKLYHRSCAKALPPTNPTAPFRALPTSTPVSRLSPLADSKTNMAAPAHAPSRLGPSWLTEKAATPPSFSTTSSSSSSPSPSRPASSLSPAAARKTQTHVVSKLQTPGDSPVATATASINARPAAAPRTSTAAAKTLQSKLKFFQSERDEEKKATTATATVVINKGLDVGARVQEAAAGHPVTVLVNVGGDGESKTKTFGGDGESKTKTFGGDGESKTKASAAAFISKKLTEEKNNNNTAKPWTTVPLKKTDIPPRVETPKRGRKVLRADPSLLADLSTPADAWTPSPAGRSGLGARTPDRGASKANGTSPNTSALENKDSPADWRSKLKPVSQPASPSQSSPKPRANGAGRLQTPEPSVGPSPSPRLPSPSISVTPPAAKGILNDQKDPTANGAKSDWKKTKPDYILKEDIMRELQEMDDNLNVWEKRGVELEEKLRSSEEEGEDDDELMVEWFNLIRNKQVAMRRESELVYIGKTQDLEEEQPTVEQELRRLMEKPERLKTTWDRKREEQLMAKLVEIVNDRNAIIDGLDEDRLREDEEDVELDKLMMNFNTKKDKPKKKSPMSKLFGWGNKKEG